MARDDDKYTVGAMGWQASGAGERERGGIMECIPHDEIRRD